MQTENKHITTLCAQIEQVFGAPMRTPQDFTCLTQSIFQRNHQSVSVSTLKRLFGYVAADGNLRRATLDILSQYVGYQDWATFCRRDLDQPVESSPLLAVSLSADEICEGDLLRVTWNPNRECHFRCTAPHTFEVERSQNSKLSVGDTFRCHLLVKGEPLYLEDLRMQGAAPIHYVCGRDGGINFFLLR